MISGARIGDRGKPKNTRIYRGAKPGFRGESPATNRLSHDTANISPSVTIKLLCKQNPQFLLVVYADSCNTDSIEILFSSCRQPACSHALNSDY
jgi:hypothetical protein